MPGVCSWACAQVNACEGVIDISMSQIDSPLKCDEFHRTTPESRHYETGDQIFIGGRGSVKIPGRNIKEQPAAAHLQLKSESTRLSGAESQDFVSQLISFQETESDPSISGSSQSSARPPIGTLYLRSGGPTSCLGADRVPIFALPQAKRPPPLPPVKSVRFHWIISRTKLNCEPRRSYSLNLLAR